MPFPHIPIISSGMSTRCMLKLLFPFSLSINFSLTFPISLSFSATFQMISINLSSNSLILSDVSSKLLNINLSFKNVWFPYFHFKNSILVLLKYSLSAHFPHYIIIASNFCSRHYLFDHFKHTYFKILHIFVLFVILWYDSPLTFVPMLCGNLLLHFFGKFDCELIFGRNCPHGSPACPNHMAVSLWDSFMVAAAQALRVLPTLN